MKRFSLSLVALTVVAAGSAYGGDADNDALDRGFYNATGVILTANAACAAVGITVGSPENGALFFPGNGRAGFVIYGPDAGTLQLGNGFSRVPSNGVAGWTTINPAVGNFTVYPFVGGTPIVIAGVTLAFSEQIIDENSAILTYVTTIPSNASIGAGCVSKTAVTWVRTGD